MTVCQVLNLVGTSLRRKALFAFISNTCIVFLALAGMESPSWAQAQRTPFGDVKNSGRLTFLIHIQKDWTPYADRSSLPKWLENENPENDLLFCTQAHSASPLIFRYRVQLSRKTFGSGVLPEGTPLHLTEPTESEWSSAESAGEDPWCFRKSKDGKKLTWLTAGGPEKADKGPTVTFDFERDFRNAGHYSVNLAKILDENLEKAFLRIYFDKGPLSSAKPKLPPKAYRMWLKLDEANKKITLQIYLDTEFTTEEQKGVSDQLQKMPNSHSNSH